jgi:C4-dicarboxylate-specific signal transduction histidine kinase
MQISLKNKIILSITLIIFVFGGLAVVSVFFYSRNEIRERSEQDLNILSSGIAHNTTQILNQISLTVKNISQREEVVEYMDSGAEEHQELYILQELQEHNIGDIYSAIYLMLPDGTTVASTDESFVGKNYGFRNYFKNALTGKFTTDVVLGVTSSKLGYYFAHPVKNKDGQIVGVAVTKLKPEVISNSVSTRRSEEDLQVMMTDNYGVVIFSNKENRLFSSLGQLGVKEQKILEEGRRFSGIDIKPLGYDLLQQNIYTINDTQTFEIYDDMDKKSEIASMVKVEEYPFFLIISRNVEEAVSSSYNLAYILSGFVLIAALFAIMSLTYLISLFMKPLRDLQDAVKKVEGGDLSYKINSDSKDEIGGLARSFDKMIIAIKESRKDVDRKIKEQTKEITKRQEQAEVAVKQAQEVSSAMAGREIKMIELKKKIVDLETKIEDNKL